MNKYLCNLIYYFKIKKYNKIKKEAESNLKNYYAHLVMKDILSFTIENNLIDKFKIHQNLDMFYLEDYVHFIKTSIIHNNIDSLKLVTKRELNLNFVELHDIVELCVKQNATKMLQLILNNENFKEYIKYLKINNNDYYEKLKEIRIKSNTISF